MRPPEFVDARREREPLDERESNVEVDGSKVTAVVEFWKRSRPANAPANPTFPMRSKSTRGRFAQTPLMMRESERMLRNDG